MRIEPLPGRFAIVRLAPKVSLPDWPRGSFVSITRTVDELSIICEEDSVPASLPAERGWRCLRVAGPIPFEVTGIAAAIATPLAAANISLFIVATYDTDYFLIRDSTWESALVALRQAGHEFSEL